MPLSLDLQGQTFGSYHVIGFAGRKGRWLKIYWLCRCICGVEREIQTSDLRTGHSTSCGCTMPAILAAQKTVHGRWGSREYKSWSAMKGRCGNKAHPDYGNYGGRGIKFCARWAKFENFLEDMGLRPDDTSLDRINNEGNYEPGNCRWATKLEQNRNRRKRRWWKKP